MTETLFIFNDGSFMRSDKLQISHNNRSFRYGDGFFETMKWSKGKILLESFHMERFFHALETFKFVPPSFLSAGYIINAITELVKKNHHQQLARVRITVYRGNGGLYDEISHYPHLLIQTWGLDLTSNKMNENGLDIGIFTGTVKSPDFFSTIKSNNYLPYAMAAIWAKERQLNDAVLLNAYGNLVDATFSNLFIVKDGLIKTPALSEGPIAGVMRRYLLEQLRKNDYLVEETSLKPADLVAADEVFLTNVISGIRWVKQFENIAYPNQFSESLYRKFMDIFL